MARKSPGKPMVGWYDPGQLAATGVEVAISSIFGKAADFRMLEALSAPQDSFDCTTFEPGQPTWVDYTGDTGDGWNSTYSVAYWITRPDLEVATEDGAVRETTQPGRVLVFGGDQVYPTASRDEYEARLVAPYEAARKTSVEPYPQLYAIPGNHDWYDNLVTFTRLFCTKEWFAGWRLRQKRSYFAVNLPYGWWLIGTDIQLGSDIDEAQLHYFKEAAKKMGPDDRVILCTAEPHWIFSEQYRDVNPAYYSDKTLSFLESRIFRDKIEIFLAGDLHHYRRHEADDGRQKITSGGGGAFLHPTHGTGFEELHQDLIGTDEAGAQTKSHSVYKKKKAYPSEATSFALGFRNLLFPLLNPKFGSVTAAVYLLFAWSILPGLPKGEGLPAAIPRAFNYMLFNPLATFIFLIIIGGFILFTDTHFQWFKWVAGGVHALLHLAAAFVLGWYATLAAATVFPSGSSRHLLLSALLIVVAGWLIGSILFGLYLLVSLNVFGRHWNEAFSSLKIEDYKNFLRMRIDPDGTLTVFPIGIEIVAKRWTKTNVQSPAYEPDGKYTKPFLIEKPIRIAPRKGGSGAA